MRFVIVLTAVLELAVSSAASQAFADNRCNLGREAEVPIFMSGLRPLISAKVNGKDAKFLLDSGAFFSMMSTSAAQEFDLRLTVSDVRLGGVGGLTRTWYTKINDFEFLSTTFHDVEFLVSGSELGNGESGLVGQNLLAHFDVEYDLAKGVIRLYKPQGCERTALAYWAASSGFSLMDINAVDRRNAHIIGSTFINGKKIRALFDTGAATSVLSLAAARNLGIDVNAPGVVAAGYSFGIGRGVAKSYIVPVSSLKIGDNEEIKNTRVRVAGIRLINADMLVGADFFLSHRVFVSNTQHRLYATYNGGAVFNLASAGTPNTDAVKETLQPEESSPTEASALPEAPPPAPAPTDASEFGRLAFALASRRDYAHALIDISKAIELNPTDPEFFYERAKIYRQTRNAQSTLDDLQRALTLKPDYTDAYIARAEVYEEQKKPPEALADLDAADKLALPQGQIRLTLAWLYAEAGNQDAAIRQWDLWIDSHPVDAHFAGALSDRCFAKAMQNKDMSSALSDCNRAMALVDLRNADNATLLANHGFVRLRQGAISKAMSDFNDALKLQPKNSRALYGRGLAKNREGKSNAGEPDFDAAEKLTPNIKEYYQRYGLAP
jgi:predicted aspartyl protease/tetratricopeptide (TPR) repeat protein